MFTILKKTLSVLLLVIIAVASVGCLSINSPDKKPSTETSYGKSSVNRLNLQG